jgi:hypothetical protein
VPADHGVGTDQEGAPYRPWQPLSEGGQDKPVARLQARPAGGALQHVELVAQQQDLELAVAMLPGDEHIQEQMEDGVNDRQQHGTLLLIGEPEMVSNLPPLRVLA